MDRKKELMIYLSGALGQIFIISIIVFLLRSIGMKIDYTTALGMLAIGIGGISSALWGIIVTIRYKKATLKKILIDFVNVRQPFSGYILVFVFLLLDFALQGGKYYINSWYIPIILFLKAILFGGIEEIGWRYTFQPILEEKFNYILSTIITFVSWGIWHLLYFYIEGSLYQVIVTEFLLGLLTNCFILSALYNKTRSLWICVMTHALINMLSQISYGGNFYVSIICKVIIIIIAIVVSHWAKSRAYIIYILWRIFVLQWENTAIRLINNICKIGCFLARICI